MSSFSQSRPLLLSVAMWANVLLALTAAAILPQWLFGSDEATINGRAFTAAELRSSPYVLLLPAMILYGASVAWSIRRRSRWARPLLASFWLIYLGGTTSALFQNDPSFGSALTSFLVSLALAGIALWYLFLKPNVIAYFSTDSAPRPVARGG